jgi:hypothetical protein
LLILKSWSEVPLLLIDSRRDAQPIWTCQHFRTDDYKLLRIYF